MSPLLAIGRIRRSSPPTRLLLAVALAAILSGATAAFALQASTGAAPRPGRVPRFSHVVLIVFENHEYGQIVGNPAVPGFNALARRGALLTNYFGLAHPSLPNYIAMVSGSTQGITSDCTSCHVGAANLADTLQAAHKTWKVYAEDLPRPGFSGGFSGLYVKRHVPFLYFDDVLGSRRRLARIVPLTVFAHDLRARRLPSFSLIVPNICHDMHDCSTATGDAWLSSFLPPLLASPELKDGVVFVVFDEGLVTDTAHGGGHIPAIVAGPLVRPGARDAQVLNHYDLLRTIEQSWQLPLLANSNGAQPIAGIWRP